MDDKKVIDTKEEFLNLIKLNKESLGMEIKFSGLLIQDINLTDTDVIGICFEDCFFSNITFDGGNFRDLTFKNCFLECLYFKNLVVGNICFNNTDIEYSYFGISSAEDIEFKTSSIYFFTALDMKVSNLHLYDVYLDKISVVNSSFGSIKGCKLDCLSLGIHRTSIGELRMNQCRFDGGM